MASNAARGKEPIGANGGQDDPYRGPSAYITIGGGLRFLSADYFLRELGPLGLSMRGFRAFCKVLKVPMIRMGRTWLVELFAFQQAMRAISRPGQPDFLAPGCDYKGLTFSERPKDSVEELDMEYFHQNMEAITGEVLAARKASGLPSPLETAQAAKRAAQRLISQSIQKKELKDRDDALKKEEEEAVRLFRETVETSPDVNG